MSLINSIWSDIVISHLDMGSRVIEHKESMLIMNSPVGYQPQHKLDDGSTQQTGRLPLFPETRRWAFQAITHSYSQSWSHIWCNEGNDDLLP